MTPITSRAALGGDAIRGPLIIREFDATTAVPPDFHVMRDGLFNIVMTQSDRVDSESSRRERQHESGLTNA
jgi:hypothetical protein